MSDSRANLYPGDREADLMRAKGEFQARMLGNDAFFAALATKLDLETSRAGSELPDFACEPTIEFVEDGVAMGVCIRASRSNSLENIGELGLYFAALERIGIAKADSPQGMADPDPSLVDLLRIA